jgi:hypothetical protein
VKRIIVEVEALVAVSIIVEVGDGLHSFFRTDKWIDGRSIADIAPALLNAVRPQVRRKKTMAQGLENNAWARDITGALTVQVIIDYLLIWDVIRQRNFIHALNSGTEDKFRWKWTTDGQFSTASAYRALFIGQHAVPGAKVLTKTRTPGLCKFFIWLAMHDRCWTGARRKRHNLQNDDNCTFCDQHSETISHLLSTCVLAKEIWFAVLWRCNLQRLTPTGTLQDFFDWWLSSRKQIRKELRKAFDSLVILVAWSIWKERNRRIFQKEKVTTNELVDLIIDDGRMWCYAGLKHLLQLFPWLAYDATDPARVVTLGRELVNM